MPRRKLLADISTDIEPVKLTTNKTSVQSASYLFTTTTSFMRCRIRQLPQPNTRYALYKTGDVSLMNWTNEPIYSINERAPIKLDRKTTIPMPVFLSLRARQLGRFIIVEKPTKCVALRSSLIGRTFVDAVDRLIGPVHQADIAGLIKRITRIWLRQCRIRQPHKACSRRKKVNLPIELRFYWLSSFTGSISVEISASSFCVASGPRFSNLRSIILEVRG